MIKNIHFAPLQGYADHLYRRFHAQVYGPAYAYYTPFIRVEKNEPRKQDIARLEASIGDGTSLVPQIIFNSTDEFTILRNALKDIGIKRIDINLGCPHPMQTRKGRGAAMISLLDVLSDVCKTINDDSETSYSIKMRLGLTSADEWRKALPILNNAKLVHVAMHPRTATQMYGGELRLDQFAEFLSESSNPVIFNGDILTIKDIEDVESSYPGIAGVMIGRGLLARPSLIAEYQTGQEWTQQQRLQKLLQFHSLLYAAYCDTLCGETQILQKIKPFWDFLEPEIGRKSRKALTKAVTLAKYDAALASLPC